MLGRALLKMQTEAVAAGLDYRARFVTLTAGAEGSGGAWGYDCSNNQHMTSEAMRARVDGLRRSLNNILANERARAERPDLIGAVACPELAGVGHVHMHVVYFGPFVEVDRWRAWGRADYKDSKGRIRPGWGDLGDQLKPKLVRDLGAVREVVKYPIKSPGSGPRAAQWLGDREARSCVHPTLVARWEIATFGARMVVTWGSFRKLETATQKKARRAERRKGSGISEELRPAVPCVCGSTIWHVVNWSVVEWITVCNLAGVPPLGMPWKKRGNDGREQRGQDRGDGAAVVVVVDCIGEPGRRREAPSRASA